MLFTLSIAGQRLAYPDRAERNPKKKTPAWIAQYLRAFTDDVLRTSDFAHWYHAASDNEKRLRYVFGQQDPARYERFAEPATRDTDPSGISQKLDKRILPVVPKHVRILSDKLAEQEFAPSVTVIDERAEQEMATHLDRIRDWQQHGELYTKPVGAGGLGQLKPEELPANMPEDEDDLRLYAGSEYQHEDAVAMEQKIALCLSEANYKQIDRDVVLHFFAFGEGAQYLGADLNGRPSPTMLLPGRCLFKPSAYEDYRDMRAGAHIDYLTLGQLRAEAGDQLSEEQYQWIASNAATSNAADWYLPAGMGQPSDCSLVQVVRGSFLSEDDLVWKTKADRRGNRVTKRGTADPNADFRGSDITRRTALNVYEGVLIVGTEWSYNCRLAVKQLRDMDNPLRGLLPYAAFTPGMLGGRNSCAMDEVMPIADFVQEWWLRLQEAALRYVPNGYNYDPEGMLEAVSMLKGNNAKEGLDLKKAMGMFYRTGSTVGKRKARDGSLLPPPITRLENNATADLDIAWTSLRAGLQMLESIMSSNAVVSAATPNPEVTKGQAELAVAGTMSSLGYLAHGKQMLFNNVCRMMGIRIWLTEASQPVVGSYAPGGGQPPVRVKPRPELARRRFNFDVSRKPTAAEWQQFYAVLQRALDAKEITGADYAFVVEVDNIKEARRILAQRAKRNAQQAQALTQQNQQATIEGQIRSAQEAEKAKQQTIQVQLRATLAVKKVEGENAARVATIYVEGQQHQEQERGDAKLLQSQQEQQAGAVRDALADHRAAAPPDPRQEYSQLVAPSNEAAG